MLHAQSARSCFSPLCDKSSPRFSRFKGPQAAELIRLDGKHVSVSWTGRDASADAQGHCYACPAHDCPAIRAKRGALGGEARRRDGGWRRPCARIRWASIQEREEVSRRNVRERAAGRHGHQIGTRTSPFGHALPNARSTQPAVPDLAEAIAFVHYRTQVGSHSRMRAILPTNRWQLRAA
ncbi:hypothetical protein T492DRAFT_963952 [Pavlovales sp. CCMP2436]|nr:hypothetical protein T492DRAFT_963952 [Pavlovales sp. CCMP2436]